MGETRGQQPWHIPPRWMITLHTHLHIQGPVFHCGEHRKNSWSATTQGWMSVFTLSMSLYWWSSRNTHTVTTTRLLKDINTIASLKMFLNFSSLQVCLGLYIWSWLVPSWMNETNSHVLPPIYNPLEGNADVQAANQTEVINGINNCPPICHAFVIAFIKENVHTRRSITTINVGTSCILLQWSSLLISHLISYLIVS